jgi:hypothetical protein
LGRSLAGEAWALQQQHGIGLETGRSEAALAVAEPEEQKQLLLAKRTIAIVKNEMICRVTGFTAFQQYGRGATQSRFLCEWHWGQGSFAASCNEPSPE